MTELRRFQAADAMLLLLVLAVAFLARASYLWACTLPQYPGGWLQVQHAVTGAAGQKEDPELSELYHNFKEDKGFASHTPFGDKDKVELTAHTSPGYPLLLGLLGRALDDESLRSWIRWMQAGLGALTAGLYFLFARRAFRSLMVGTLAGLFCALYPFWIINVAEMEDGTLASFLLALGLFLGARGIQTGGPLSSLLYGLVMAGLALVRAACLPFAFVAVAWYLLRSRSVTRGWLCALLAFLGFVNGLLPWTVRNFQIFNEPVPVVDSAYYHLWIGNNPQATGGPMTESAENAAREQLDRDAPDRKLAALGQTERFARLGRLVRDFWRDDSLKAVQLRIRATLDFLLGERWFTTGELANRTAVVIKHDEDNTSETPPLPYIENGQAGILHGALVALFALAFLGWRWSYGWRRESMPASLAVVWIPLPYILGHAEALSGPRLPLDGVLLCYAAFAAACLIPGVGYELFRGSKSTAD